MKTYNALKCVSDAIIKSGLCEAILLKGSIGRGDDDEYSDVDMYAIVKKENADEFMKKRIEYLSSYMPVIFHENVNFVAEQIVAIYEDGLHFDLYTLSEDELKNDSKIKVVYDPKNLFENYAPELYIISEDELKNHFTETLYCFTEAYGAYKRGNYPWSARIMDNAIASASILIRYIFDKDYAYLGLKKINEVIPKEQFEQINKAYSSIFKDDFKAACINIIEILEYVIENIDADIKNEFDMKFFNWSKKQFCE